MRVCHTNILQVIFDDRHATCFVKCSLCFYFLIYLLSVSLSALLLFFLLFDGWQLLDSNGDGDGATATREGWTETERARSSDAVQAATSIEERRKETDGEKEREREIVRQVHFVVHVNYLVKHFLGAVEKTKKAQQEAFNSKKTLSLS